MSQFDYLHAWHRARDPLRTRMAISNADYGWSGVACKRAYRSIPDKLKAYGACVLIGASLGVWLALEMSK
jgi:hypothetical protein